MNDDIGLIGLGRMGLGLAANMVSRGIRVHAWDPSPQARERAQGTKTGARTGAEVKLHDGPAALAAALPRHRCVMLMVPAGDAVDQCLETLSGLLDAGDVVVDAGNSHYSDTERRQAQLAAKGLDLLGLGVSGGPEGARVGPSLMAGGPAAAWRRAGPVLEAVAARAGDDACAGRLGAGGAGHFVKTAHNGIEYAVMQILADVHEILRVGCGLAPDAVAEAFDALDDGPTAGFLTAVSARVAAQPDNHGPGFLMDAVDDRAGQMGTGRWALEAALDLGVPVPTMAAAVAFRTLSSADRLRAEARDGRAAGAAAPPLVASDLLPLLAPALACALASAFAQGFALLAMAGDRFGAPLDLARIARLWRAGCILRGDMVARIADSLASEPGRCEILGSEGLRPLVADGMAPLGRVTAMALAAGLPAPGLASAHGYVAALGRDRLSTAMVQLQRDYFGGHGLRRAGPGEGGREPLETPWRDGSGEGDGET